MKITTTTTGAQFVAFMIVIVVVTALSGAVVHTHRDRLEESAKVTSEAVFPTASITEADTEVITEAPTEELTEEPIEELNGFSYYQIPQQYVEIGGNFPEEVQKYAYTLCEELQIDYYIVVALIERESGYKIDASGDSGNSKGYMQIWESWHTGRMQELGVEDLYNPYSNLLVGITYLNELYEKYDSWSLALMAYNMGESGASGYWNKGIYDTNYSLEIQQRAVDIEQELKQD